MKPPVKASHHSKHKGKTRVRGHKIGNMVLKEIDTLCLAFDLTRPQALNLCHHLRVPLVYIGESVLFNETAMTRIFFVLTRIGGPGYAAPGSHYKESNQHMRNRDKPHAPALEITNDMLDDASSHSLLAELAIESGRQKPTMAQLSKLMTNMPLSKKATP